MMPGAGARQPAEGGGDDRRPRRMLTALRQARSHGQFRRGVYLLPSMFTMANLFCGYACVIYAMRAHAATEPDARAMAFATAAVFIGVAALVDMLDGRIARMTGTTSEFGMELDSLADIVSFGLGPAILAFAWGLEPLGRLGWAGAFLYVTCAALRLARFNIQTGSVDKRYFVGMPSPAAAAVIATTVFFWPEGLHGYTRLVSVAVLALVLVPGFLMVSTVRFRAFKSLGGGARRPYQNLLLVAIAIVAIAVEPQAVLMGIAYTYLLSAFIGHAYARMRRRRGSVSARETVADPSAPQTPPPDLPL